MDPDDLLGSWRFERLIDDRLAQGDANRGEDRGRDRRIPVVGIATFERSGPDRIVWVESGTMSLPGGDVPVSAERVLSRDPDGSWVADFADGREFHEWRWGAELVHDCAPDLYGGRLDGDADGWRMCWSAAGPRKDYVIETAYRRV